MHDVWYFKSIECPFPKAENMCKIYNISYIAFYTNTRMSLKFQFCNQWWIFNTMICGWTLHKRQESWMRAVWSCSKHVNSTHQFVSDKKVNPRGASTTNNHKLKGVGITFQCPNISISNSIHVKQKRVIGPPCLDFNCGLVKHTYDNGCKYISMPQSQLCWRGIPCVEVEFLAVWSALQALLVKIKILWRRMATQIWINTKPSLEPVLINNQCVSVELTSEQFNSECPSNYSVSMACCLTAPIRYLDICWLNHQWGSVAFT